ncbi:MAG: hypothetical protein ACREFR_01395 [Limisphaerales bacterium]
MKGKLPASAFRRLPVDFGNEPPCSVPIHRRCAFRWTNGADQSRAREQAELARPEQSRPHPSRHRLPATAGADTFQRFNVSTLQRLRRNGAFTLVEILVVLVLLAMIVFALMAVFSGIQRAFRASLTQTDTLEGGRAVMNLIANDLATMTPANWQTNLSPGNNNPTFNYYAPVNFFADLQSFGPPFPPSPFTQPLLSSPTGQMRTNILENIFILGKENINGVPSWVGTGYSVTNNLPDGTLYPLYRFYMTTNAAAGPAGEAMLFYQFTQFQYTNSTEWSHLMDGVVDLTARVYDTNGIWMTNGYNDPQNLHVRFVQFTPDYYGPGLAFYGATECAFYSNALPASVQIEMGTMEDRTLVHAEALSGANQSNYLSNAAGQVHLFRQRVWIPNLDPTAYQ